MEPGYCPDPNCPHCELVRKFCTLYGEPELRDLTNLENTMVLSGLAVTVLEQRHANIPDLRTSEVLYDLMLAGMNYGYVLGRTKPREPVPEVFEKGVK